MARFAGCPDFRVSENGTSPRFASLLLLVTQESVQSPFCVRLTAAENNAASKSVIQAGRFGSGGHQPEVVDCPFCFVANPDVLIAQ